MSGLPKIQINVNNDGLGQVAAIADGTAGLVLTGASVNGKITEGESVQLFNLDNAIANGITKTGLNAYAYKHIKQFYDEAGKGAELWVMVVPAGILMSTMADKTEPYAKKLLDDAKGSIRLLGLSRKSVDGITIANGVDEDVDLAITNAQSLIETYTVNYKEASVIIDVNDFNGTVGDLKNYREDDKEFVTPLLANSDGSKNSAVGLFLGRLAKIPVMRNPARVKSGSLPVLNAYLTNGKPIETLESAWDAIHDKGYAFMRSFVGRAGYFFTHAPTCTLGSNDLNSIPRVRAIYKARRVAYIAFTNEILDEIPLEANGKIAPAFVKSWQGLIDNAITEQMVVKGEISGVRTIIDPSQNVLATNEVIITLKVLPVGYAEYITVNLGFVINLNNN
jgi:hypothetical protein